MPVAPKLGSNEGGWAARPSFETRAMQSMVRSSRDNGEAVARG
jgi:hypothetical protein